MRRTAASAFVVALALGSAGCAAHWAYRQGQKEAGKGNWDVAVARYTKAIEKDKDNIGYRIALENARIQASRFHYAEAQKRLAAEELEKALDELEIARKYDASNQVAAADLRVVRDKIERRDEEKRRLSSFAAMKSRVTHPVRPFLSPRSNVPIRLKFTDTAIDKVFEALSKLSGVNILVDADYRADKRISIDLSGLSFEEALDRITFTNRLFYKVLDSNTIIVAAESPTKRRTYDDLMMQTFYLDNAEANEILNEVKAITGVQKAVANQALGAITIVATPDKLAVARRVIEANDKAKGEVLVEVEILEVNRDKLRDYGIRLSNYAISSTISPTGAEGEVSATTGFSSVRAHLLSSLNLSDFILQIPATLTAKFLQTESTTRILASPRLRAAEGKKTSLRIGEEIPIPTTTFLTPQAGQPGGGNTFGNATSFTFRNVGIEMNLTPKISAGGDIALEMSAEFSLLGTQQDVGNGLKIPSFLTRKIDGTLRVRDGETTLIGGLIQTQETSGFRGIAGIPLLSKLVSPDEKKQSRREVLISLTPHIVRAPKVTERDLTALSTGTEEVVRVPSAREGQFGTPDPTPSPEPSPNASAPPAPPTPEPLVTPPPSEDPVPVDAPKADAGPEAAGAPIAATLSPAERTAKVGDTVAIDVVVMGAKDLRGVTLAVRYDPSAAQALDVGAGSLLTLDGQNVGAERTINEGQAIARFTRPVGTSGSGAVASLRFKMLRPGQTSVSVESLTIETGAGPQEPPAPLAARVTVQQ